MKFKATNKVVHYAVVAQEVRETDCARANAYYIDLMSSNKRLIDWLKGKPDEVVQWAADHGYVEIVKDDPWEGLRILTEPNGSKRLVRNGWNIFSFNLDESVTPFPNSNGSGPGNYNQKGQLIVTY